MNSSNSETDQMEAAMIQSVDAMQKLTGLEYIKAVRDGSLLAPPIGNLMGFKLTEVEEGRVVFTCTPTIHHYNPIGTVHGGLAATLLDSALGVCVHTTLPVGVGYTTLELKVNYIRPMTTKTGQVRAIGQVIHSGRRSATAEAKILDVNDKLFAHGTTTCMIFRP